MLLFVHALDLDKVKRERGGKCTEQNSCAATGRSGDFSGRETALKFWIQNCWSSKSMRTQFIPALEPQEMVLGVAHNIPKNQATGAGRERGLARHAA